LPSLSAGPGLQGVVIAVAPSSGPACREAMLADMRVFTHSHMRPDPDAVPKRRAPGSTIPEQCSRCTELDDYPA